ncbi:MAG TPA: Crp/Fnr family transcriptional regulator [Ideonella sp.]|uniref:Crp/Fnr family transcriptional regulator n=1 Tax=Ideonella sp. TaxID=1929293 RepID=UPI002C9757C5|nr:Crp/Fnr family transcriptional regulator [Ideonella sp.]HSI48920.1 Crp/Fnr family transcriptional regulator [Ideonella sp.]
MPSPEAPPDSSSEADHADGETPRDNSLLIQRVLRWTELFSEWPYPRIANLMLSARLVRHARGALVLGHDIARRELLVLVSGMVEISRTNADGRKYLHSFMSPGHVAPLVRLLDEIPLGFYNYTAHEESQVIHLPADAVIAELDAEPRLWKDVSRLALRRQRESLQSLHQQVLGSLRVRLAATLASLAGQTGTPLRSGQSLSIGLSQGDLATMLGVSRQTMNKELRQLADEAVVAAVYKRIMILDADKLRDIAANG